MKRHKFLAGDWVIVRSRDEIFSTLDADGTLDGLPFMPEMQDWCGKPFRVERRAEKTCVDVAPPIPPNRRFAADDVVFLDGPRCDGGITMDAIAAARCSGRKPGCDRSIRWRR